MNLRCVRARPHVLVGLAVAFVLLVMAVPAGANTSGTGLVISQVYGGAGCGTAGCSTYTNDYIEIFNPTASDVPLTGWSVQYASAAGTAWQTIALTGTVASGKYYLVKEGAGVNGVSPLPAVDDTGTIAMSATGAKVALANSTAAFSGSCPTGAVDFVGYGTTPDCFEGAGRAPAPSTTNAIFRASGGCSDTDNNSADFAAAAASPRNTLTPPHFC